MKTYTDYNVRYVPIPYSYFGYIKVMMASNRIDKFKYIFIFTFIDSRFTLNGARRLARKRNKLYRRKEYEVKYGRNN
jgi:hypothetical protein